MVNQSLSQKPSRFTLLIKIWNNSSCLVPVSLLPFSNSNMHMLYCIVVKRESPGLSEWRRHWSFYCVHSKIASFTGLFTWKYNLDELYSMRGTIYICTPYFHIWDDNILFRLCPVAPSQISHMPRICLFISINRLLLLIFRGLLLSRGIIMPRIKGSYTG